MCTYHGMIFINEIQDILTAHSLCLQHMVTNYLKLQGVCE